jgi:hypothetical protein
MEALKKYYFTLHYILEIYDDIKTTYLYDQNIDNKYNIYDIELLLKIVNSISAIWSKSREGDIPTMIEAFNNYNCVNINENVYINLENVNTRLGNIFYYTFTYRQSVKERIIITIQDLSFIKSLLKYDR